MDMRLKHNPATLNPVAMRMAASIISQEIDLPHSGEFNCEDNREIVAVFDTLANNDGEMRSIRSMHIRLRLKISVSIDWTCLPVDR